MARRVYIHREQDAGIAKEQSTLSAIFALSYRVQSGVLVQLFRVNVAFSPMS